MVRQKKSEVSQLPALQRYGAMVGNGCGLLRGFLNHSTSTKRGEVKVGMGGAGLGKIDCNRYSIAMFFTFCSSNALKPLLF